MAAPAWNHAPLPKDPWNTAPVPEHSTWMQSTGSEWHSHGVPVTAQDLHALGAASWLNVSHGPVDLGLSPVLSHESQSTHTLNSLPESDIPLLPPGLDLSFIAEPSWEVSGPVMYSSPHVTQDFTHAIQELPSGLPMNAVQAGYSVPQSMTCPPQQPMFFFHGGQVPQPRRTASDPSVPQRPLLPRSESKVETARYRSLQPLSPSTGRAGSTTSVSSTHGHCSDATIPGNLASHGFVAQYTGMPVPGHGLVTPRPDSAPLGRPAVMDHTSEDFSGFIRYDQDNRKSSIDTSCSHDTRAMPQVQSDDQVTPCGAASASSDGDEGRHRNHPLYSEGPQPDGLYHCPFKSDPNCQHKATKLKCNYDKFIDSHLKPFRCKVEACSKQEFSSTACLLRHEREAHGMHGHGDRPHLCYYRGCERGIPGNGFPRRYNLFDHMKRVHDHKEEPSPILGASDARKAGGRKRKAPASVSEEPAAQRPKLQPVQQPSPPLSLASTGYAQMATYPEVHPVQDQQRQQAFYTQWANQRDLIEFQMNSVRGPDDEANIHRLSQNVEELRRLSQQARHG